MRFYGNIEAKADAKGRVFLPAAFRKILEKESQERIYMRKDVFQPCLTLYPESTWNKEYDLLASRVNRYDKKQQMVLRQFVAEVTELTLDGNGRLLIPKRYMKLAGIEQEVRFIGCNDTIEIWAKETSEEPFMTAEDFEEALQDIMKEKED